MLEGQLTNICTFRWRGHLLNGEVSPDGPEVDLGQRDLTELMIDLFPRLEWFDFVMLLQQLQKNPELAQAINPIQLAEHHGLNYNSRLQQFVDDVESWPPAFLQWCRLKKATGKDLAPLLASKNSQGLNLLLEAFSKENPSRSDGRQMLDWLVDLLMMGNEPTTLLPQSDSPWKQQLFNSRYPETSRSDQKRSTKVWPKYCRHSQFRQGDRLENSLAINYKDEQELTQRLEHILNSLVEK